MTAEAPVDVLAEVQARLLALKQDFAARYGEDLSQLEASVDAAGAVVRGTVVVPRQLDLLQQRFRDWPPVGVAGTAAGPVRFEVAVLAGSRTPPHDQAWMAHPQRGPEPLWSRRDGGKLVTEWLAADGPARLLVDAEPRALLALVDETVGWADRAGLQATAAPSQPTPVLGAGETVEVSEEALAELKRAALEAAERGVPYRLGGRDWEAGLDCSAFVQRLLWTHAGVLLPRHTGDQMQTGVRVGRGELQPGDLLFARTADKNHLHVALLVAPDVVVHACRLDERVRSQGLDDFLSRYRYLRAQRMTEASAG